MVKSIASIVGIAIGLEPIHLGRGVASSAWCIQSSDGSFVVRFMLKNTHLPCTYVSEATILRHLWSAGELVPRPVGTNSDDFDSELRVSVPWSVTALVPGIPLRGSPLSDQHASDLAGLIASLHQLPIAGFGPLQQIPNALIGTTQSAIAGMRRRWRSGQAWPIDGSALRDHPIFETLPAVAHKLALRESTILELATSDTPSLVHSDLHDEHIFVQGGRLSGVIDFGGAFIASAPWDFASLAVFLGWKSAELVAYHYLDRRPNSLSLPAIVATALTLALYRLSVEWRSDPDSTEVARLIRFIDETALAKTIP